MRERLKDAGDLTKGMWERAVSIADKFDRVGEKPPGQGPKPRKRTGEWRDWRTEYETKRKERR
jgi:hypothetical protein